jgi:hypothetical protein
MTDESKASSFDSVCCVAFPPLIPELVHARSSAVRALEHEELENFVEEIQMDGFFSHVF